MLTSHPVVVPSFTTFVGMKSGVPVNVPPVSVARFTVVVGTRFSMLVISLLPRTTVLVGMNSGVPVHMPVDQVAGLTVVVGTRESGTRPLRFSIRPSRFSTGLLLPSCGLPIGLAQLSAVKQTRLPTSD